MRTERYNIYDKIHTDLRKQVLDAGLRIQATDFNNPKAVSETFLIIKKVIRSFEEYAEKDSMVFRAVATAASYIVLVVEKVNENNKQLTLSLAGKMDQYLLTRTNARRKTIGAEIQRLFFEFMASVLQNINKEETIINDLLWSVYTDNELAEMEAKIVSTVATAEVIAATEQEITGVKMNLNLQYTPVLFKNPTPSVTGKVIEMINSIAHPDRRKLIKKYLSMPP